MFDKIKVIDWQKYTGRNRLPDINLLLYKLTSSVELVQMRAHSELITELDIAYKEGKDLGVAIVPFLIEILTHPEIAHKSIILDILVYLTSYLHASPSEPYKSYAKRIQRAVCENLAVYQSLIEKNELADDASELIAICEEQSML